MHDSRHGRRAARARHREAQMMGARGPRHGRRGHRARRGDVRSAILALVKERPMHGYEMIQELEQRTAGRWTPSAGSIYPTLQLLEDEGLVKGEEVDGRRVFSLTASGSEAIEERGSERPPWEGEREDSARYELRAEIGRLMAAAKQIVRTDEEKQLQRAAEILKDARRKLYSILADE